MKSIHALAEERRCPRSRGEFSPCLVQRLVAWDWLLAQAEVRVGKAAFLTEKQHSPTVSDLHG
jgi:hypothetical protein